MFFNPPPRTLIVSANASGGCFLLACGVFRLGRSRSVSRCKDGCSGVSSSRVRFGEYDSKQVEIAVRVDGFPSALKYLLSP